VAPWYEDCLQYETVQYLHTCMFLVSSFFMYRERMTKFWRAQFCTNLSTEHLPSKNAPRRTPGQQQHISYSIHAKHELQQSLETNQTKEIISLHTDKEQL